MSTPAKIRTVAAAAVALACCLAAVIAVASGALGGQFQAIGSRDAPTVNSTTGLYFSLNDMDAQVANVLLVGGDAALAADRSQDLAIYGSDRATADADLTQALASEDADAAAQRELRSVLDGVGQYEALAADALLTDQQGRSSVGRAPAASLAYYQQATDLMATTILPSVSSLTGVSASRLDASYADGRSTASSTAVVVIAAGVALIAVLVALQLYLSARFRRLVSPALAAATVVALALVITAATRLSTPLPTRSRRARATPLHGTSRSRWQARRCSPRWCWPASGRGWPNITKSASITPNGPWRLSLAAGDRERGPGAQVDHIAVAQPDGFARRDLDAVDQRAVG
jgi:hypothetical protein